MQNNKKYIYACIRLPMEVCDDGHYEPHPECTKIFFERCDKLPEETSIHDNNLDAILKTLSDGMVIPISDIKTNKRKKHSLSTTFKNRPQQVGKSRYSVKNRD